jgi:REP-associated tyrosine transposase
MARPPRIPVRLPSGQTVTYFITICVAQRLPVLANETVFNIVEEFCASCEQWSTSCAVIMPDHLHALIQPKECRDIKPTTFSTPLKRIVRQQTNANWQWQDGVFDRLLRKNEFAEAKWHYMRENPVRNSLVRSWQDWPYFIESQL